ncbi:hypothetical protein P8452_19761 [Trifolium repens]|nr:Tetratricopeptide repeat (TPR) superfamily protein [Trifolium repens]WJX31323.1 hypothetical protein P8452_19761 [Trifolium repens]
MGLKVLQLSHNVLSHSPSSSQTLASAISSSCSSSKPRNKFVPNSTTLFRSTNFVLQRSRSLPQYPLSIITRKRRTLRRAISASLDSFSDEEFAKKIEDLALRFQISSENNAIMDLESFEQSLKQSLTSSVVNFAPEFEPPWNGGHGLHGGGRGEEIIPAIIERKANSVELPFSLRIIKEKLKLKEEFREVGESARCSVKKAFSSMVFIIRELQCFTLQMREVLFYEDLQGILERVQKEMHASFVWLFQQVFSHTPTLMVYVMILLANFTVHSMSSNSAIAAVATPPPETSSIVEFNESRGHHHGFHKFDSSAIKTFSVSNGNNTASVDGGTGGGGKYKPVASGFDGDGRFDQTGTGFSNGGVYKTGENETESSVQDEEEETKLWESMVKEASRNEVGLDHEAMKKFVSPVTAKIESDDYAEYLRTELVYQTALSQEPNNVLLLANYAQFLYIVTHEFDRAEEYFKKAIEVEPPDAEAFNKYATFLWKVKNDLWAAEETYLEAISAEPSNTYYAANYAHFLWNTGGEDTCFPLSDDNSQEV